MYPSANVATGERDYSHRSLVDKLGVRPGHRVTLLGVQDPGFLHDLRERGADVSVRRRKRTDLVFLAIEDTDGLDALAALEPSMERDGAIWMVHPKGRKDLREVDIISRGVAAGWVDNKVVRFSDTHTALRFVIPVARR
jgi:hypothetical protein